MEQDKQEKGITKLLSIWKRERKINQTNNIVSQLCNISGIDSDKIVMHVKYHNNEERNQIFEDYVVKYNYKKNLWKEIKGD